MGGGVGTVLGGGGWVGTEGAVLGGGGRGSIRGGGMQGPKGRY